MNFFREICTAIYPRLAVIIIIIIIIFIITVIIIAPQGFCPEAKSRGGTLVTRAYIGQYLQFKYTVSMLEKISICSNWGREESVANDDVSIVCARKYEMVRLT